MSFGPNFAQSFFGTPFFDYFPVSAATKTSFFELSGCFRFDIKKKSPYNVFLIEKLNAQLKCNGGGTNLIHIPANGPLTRPLHTNSPLAPLCEMCQSTGTGPLSQSENQIAPYPGHFFSAWYLRRKIFSEKNVMKKSNKKFLPITFCSVNIF